jgi:hypothetical protein
MIGDPFTATEPKGSKHMLSGVGLLKRKGGTFHEKNRTISKWRIND